MKILHLEDDKKWFDGTVYPFLKKIDNLDVLYAQNKEDALNILCSNDIDFAILDLSVPSDEKSQTSDIQHGLYVAQYIRSNHPGIPITILTGQSTETAAEQFENENTFTTFWNGAEKPLIKIRPKRKVAEVIEYIEEISTQLIELDSIELDFNPKKILLSLYEKRVIRLFCLHHMGCAAKIEPLSDGLSSAKVLSVSLINSNGHTFHYALAKVGTNSLVDLEKQNFHEHIIKLSVGSFPTYLNEYYAGCGAIKGVFFQFAANYNKNYFQSYLSSDNDALEAASATKEIFSNWVAGRHSRLLSILDIRRMFCSDEKIAQHNIAEQLKENGLDIDSFERIKINFWFAPQHSDLHGLNILISEQNKPLIIDYGDVKVCPAAIDPVTLELSQYFHPHICKELEINERLAEKWFDDNEHHLFTDRPETARFLRQWSRENCFLAKNYNAIVYSYLIRQLTYPDTNKVFAIDLLKSAISNAS